MTLSWRPVAESDLDAISALYREWESERDLPYRTSREEIEHEMTGPETDLDRDTLVADVGDGRLVASAWIELRARPGSKHRAFVATTALREYAGLEAHALRWAADAVQRHFSTFDDDLQRVVRGFGQATDLDRVERYESCGFEIVRYFADMAMPLPDSIPQPTLPDGVELASWDDRWAASAHQAQVASFADHWGAIPPTREEFEYRLAWPGTRLDLSVLAIADGSVASFSLNGVYPQDFELRGRSEGSIDTLGTLREWRKQGLASALINESLRRFKAEGLEYAAIDVDVASPTGAFGLYERLGFVEQHRSVSLMKKLAKVAPE